MTERRIECEVGILRERRNELIRSMWPQRNDYFGVRLMLRGLIRQGKRYRDA